MKSSTRQLFLSAAIAFLFTFALASFAEDAPPAAPEKEQSAPAAQPAQAQPEADHAAAPATPVATAAPAPDLASSATPSAPPAATPAPSEHPGEPAKLRRLDTDESTPSPGPRRSRRHYNHGNEIVTVARDAFLAKDRKADAVVAVFGSATSEGEVQDAVVSIIGNTKVSGSAGNGAVAVFGNTHVTGPVGDAAIAVFGNTYVNSKVGNAVVAVFGSVELGPEADVNDVVAIGGSVKRDPKAVIHGELHNIAFGGMFSDTEWLRSWLVNCAMYGRLLAFGPNLMWAWWVAICCLVFYLFLALLFGKGVEKCVQTLETRPGYTVLAALLTVLLAPVAMIILVITGVGIAIVPFLAAGLFFAGLFGKAVMLGWIGRRITRLLGIDNILLAVLIGGLIVMALYTIPVVGLVVYKLIGWIGLGAVVLTLTSGMKRERPPAAPVPGSPGTAAGAPSDPSLLPVPAGSPVVTPAVVAVATLPRAGFWIRMAALVIDVILVGIVLALFRSSGKMELLALAAYGACMWKLRGSTIGGIICGLKVVRLDGREIDWSTAIVRALGCFLSLAVLGLGFIWVAFDDQKQSWHDKVAGTTVVRVPKGVSLV